MDGADGRSGSGVDPKSLVEARTLTHNAIHWLARLAHSYAAPEPELQHIWLGYDPARSAFLTRPLVGSVSCELRLPLLEMQFREGDTPVPHVLNVEGHSPAKVEAWMLVELLHRGIDRERFTKDLPYPAANLMSGDNVDFSPEACAKELDALSRWLGHASAVLLRLGGELGSAAAGPGRLVCWPDQCHIGIVVGADPTGSASPRQLRVGLSMGDERYPEPYFLVAPQRGGAIDMPHPGAVLTASRIIADGMGEDEVLATLHAAVATTRRRLAN